MRAGTPTRGRLAVRVACAAAALALAAPAAGQPRYRPSLRFETLATPHFVIHFHQGEENLARRLALVAEDVHATLAVKLQARPRDRTSVILVDQHDLANGWATVFPVNTIEIDAAWPRSDDLLGNTDDWLRLVFTHEYTHILQMDVSRGFARALRGLFGRSPLAFPNLALPGWLTEGLPTYEESRLTGRGRLRSGSFRAIVDEPLRAGRALPIDRAAGGLTYWPSGIAPYAWGGYFVQYLADRFGEERLAALTNETAGRFYFLSPPAFRRVFGEGLGTLWREFQRSRADAAVEESDVAAAGLSRLTSHGYLVTGPRVIGDEVLYSTIDAHGFPALRSVPLDGRTPGRRLADRYLGDGLGAAGGLVWFDQMGIEDAVALRSDLYVLERDSGSVTRVTRGGRYLDVDVSPDGRALAAVALRDGRRRLAILDVVGDLTDPARISVAERMIVGENAAEYSAPRWSPDGRSVAAARAWLGGRSDIVVIDTATGQPRSVASSADGRNTSPCWTPDGRTILFASDRAGGALNLFAVDVPPDSLPVPESQPPVYQVTERVSGAAEPALTSDGRMIVFVGYTADGYDLFSIPVDRAAWSPWR